MNDRETPTHLKTCRLRSEEEGQPRLPTLLPASRDGGGARKGQSWTAAGELCHPPRSASTAELVYGRGRGKGDERQNEAKPGGVGDGGTGSTVAGQRTGMRQRRLKRKVVKTFQGRGPVYPLRCMHGDDFCRDLMASVFRGPKRLSRHGGFLGKKGPNHLGPDGRQGVGPNLPSLQKKNSTKHHKDFRAQKIPKSRILKNVSPQGMGQNLQKIPSPAIFLVRGGRSW